jgi:hypothetical protein
VKEVKHVVNNSSSPEIKASISPFFETEWKPSDYRQLINQDYKTALKGRGYLVLNDFFKSETIDGLNRLKEEHTHEGANEIGMFMSAYSSDVRYRKDVHQRIGELIEPELSNIFTSFKPILYNFVIKQPRPEHSLKLHQDMALIDEQLSSPINMWICTMDTKLEHGPVHLVPKTQYLFPAYRSLYTELDIANINDTLLKYAVPICLKKGDLLIFDSRLIHGSLPNTSGKDRVAVVGHICPEDAQFTMVINSENGKEDDFELVRFEREDLFQAKEFESAKKSEFNGTTRSRIRLNRINVESPQLEHYFASVEVPENNPILESSAGTSGKNQETDSARKNSLRKLMYRVFKR